MSTAASAWIGEPQLGKAPRVPEPSRPAVNEAAVSSLVGRNLRRLRKLNRLSLEELSQQSGVSRAMLGQIELGKSIPSIKTLWQVAQALNVSVSWFLESEPLSQVLLMDPPEDSPTVLRAGEGELRSLQHLGDGARDAFYELRLAPHAVLSLPASAVARRVNAVVASGSLCVEVDDVVHVVSSRQALQYRSAHALVWRNAGTTDVLAFVLVRAAVKQE